MENIIQSPYKINRLFYWVGGFILLTIAVYFIFPYHLATSPWNKTEWIIWFRPAILLMASGQNPYSALGWVFNPAYAYVLLAPVALLPPSVGGAALFVITYLCFGIAAYRLGATPLAITAFLASPFVYETAHGGNLDWMPILGLTLPPQIGLFFVLAKPQMGFCVAFIWAIEAYQRGRLVEIARVFLPVLVATAAGLVIYGSPFQPQVIALPGAWWSLTFFPYSVAAGVAILLYAIRKHNVIHAAFASPFFSPYMGVQSWIIAFVPFMAYPLEMLGANLVLWIIKFLALAKI